MENFDHRNTLVPEIELYEEYEFHYNFINMPWDDRSRKSKISVVLLLVAIFIATFACVINNFIVHYRGIGSNSQNTGTSEHGNFTGNNYIVNCQLVRAEDYRFLAKIYSLKSRELICIGAVISETTVLVNRACVKDTQVRVHVGSPTDIRCKNGFKVQTVEVVVHEGMVGKELLLLITNKTIMRCALIIQLSKDKIQKNTQAFIIGRSLNGNSVKTLSRQPVQIVGTGSECSCQGLSAKHVTNIICVKSLVQCPILAGDMLIQGGLLYGIASANIYRRNQIAHVCFADLISLFRFDVRLL